MRTILLGCLVIVAVGVASAPAPAFEGPDGFDKAKFGMRSEAFAKAYPDAVSAASGAGTEVGGKIVPITAYKRDKVTVGPLKDCHASYRFHLDELYDIQFRCPDKEGITKYLQSRFGTPNRTTDKALMWAGKTYGVSQVPRNGVFSFHDVARGTTAQGAIMRALAMSFPTPTPGATP